MSFFIRKKGQQQQQPNNKRKFQSGGGGSGGGGGGELLPNKLSGRVGAPPARGGGIGKWKRGGGGGSGSNVRGRGGAGGRGRGGRGGSGGGGGGLKRARFNNDDSENPDDGPSQSKRRFPQKNGGDDEEITSEEDDDDEGDDDNQGRHQQSSSDKHLQDLEGVGDDDDDETPQQARIRLAKEQINELKKRLKKKREEGGGGGGSSSDDGEGDDDDENVAVGKLLRQQEMVEEGRALQKIVPGGYREKELDVKVVLRGGKVLKSPLTSVATATTTVTAQPARMIYASTKSGHVIAYNLATDKKVYKHLQPPPPASSKSKPPQNKKKRNPHQQQPVTCIVASSNFVAACTPTEISLLDPETLEVVKKLSGSRDAVWMCIDEGSSGSGSCFLYSSHKDRTVKVWDLGEGGGAYVESLFGHQDIPSFVDCGGGGGGLRSRRIVVSTGGFDKSIRLWKVEEESHLVYNCWEGEDILDVVKVIGGGLFVVGGGTSGSLGLYSFGRKKVLDVVEKAHGCSNGGMVPRWITAVGGCGDFVASGSDDGIVKVWRVKVVGGRRTLEWIRDVNVCTEQEGKGGGVIIGIHVIVSNNDGSEGSAADESELKTVSMVIGIGTEMRNGRWGGRACNMSRVVIVT